MDSECGRDWHDNNAPPSLVSDVCVGYPPRNQRVDDRAHATCDGLRCVS
jgi:hypothetical protein